MSKQWNRKKWVEDEEFATAGLAIVGSLVVSVAVAFIIIGLIKWGCICE